MTYIYAKDNNGASPNMGKMYNNRLYQVQDKQSVAARFATDIDDQGALSYALTYPTTGMPNTNLTALGSSNYQYDLTGQLVKDNAEKISTIKWTVYGKVSEVVYTAAANKPDLKFVYDATGNRVAKILRKVDKTADSTVQYYFRDAQGNPLDIVQPVVSNNIYTENHEYSIYGSSRVGNYSTTHGFVAQNGAMILERMLGKRQYELSNHLGNVLTTITDQKYRVSNVNTDYLYQPIVTSATDYFPFGMQMPGRTYNLAGKKVRYGFNGKEMDNEVSGQGNQYDYGFRIYNTRLGKFLSVDPLTKGYPMLTPYQFASNTPIWAIDVDGLEAIIYSQIAINNGDLAKLNITHSMDVKNNSTITHKFGNKILKINLDINGPKTQELQELYDNGSFKDKMKYVVKHPSVGWYGNDLQGSVALLNSIDNPNDEGDYADNSDISDMFRHKVSSQIGDQDKAADLGNTFRHILLSATLTQYFDVGFAKFFGDCHERDDNGIYGGNKESDGYWDSMADFINNGWGRDLGIKLSKKYNLYKMNNKMAAEYLNEVADYVTSSFDEYKNVKVRFDKGDKFVKNFAKAFKKINARYGNPKDE